MSRTIDADALIKKLGIADDCAECRYDKPPYCMWKPDIIDVCEAICDAPTIEPKPHWIPCIPSELPKDKMLWVTHDNGFFRYVEVVSYDMTEWSESVSDVVAYMPYEKPEPYER